MQRLYFSKSAFNLMLILPVCGKIKERCLCTEPFYVVNLLTFKKLHILCLFPEEMSNVSNFFFISDEKLAVNLCFPKALQFLLSLI